MFAILLRALAIFLFVQAVKPQGIIIAVHVHVYIASCVCALSCAYYALLNEHAECR